MPNGYNLHLFHLENTAGREPERLEPGSKTGDPYEL